MKLRSALIATVFASLMAVGMGCPCGQTTGTSDVPGAFFYCGEE